MKLVHPSVKIQIKMRICLQSLSLCGWFTSFQVTQIASQTQVQAELSLRLTQLQTRLASLKIENEEVRLQFGRRSNRISLIRQMQ